MKDILSDSKNNHLTFELDTRKVSLPELDVMSPEWGQEQRKLIVKKINDHISHIHVSLEDTKIYAVAQ